MYYRYNSDADKEFYMGNDSKNRFISLKDIPIIMINAIKTESLNRVILCVKSSQFRRKMQDVFFDVRHGCMP